jgi:hypothetical protein
MIELKENDVDKVVEINYSYKNRGKIAYWTKDHVFVKFKNRKFPEKIHRRNVDWPQELKRRLSVY